MSEGINEADIQIVYLKIKQFLIRKKQEEKTMQQKKMGKQLTNQETDYPEIKFNYPIESEDQETGFDYSRVDDQFSTKKEQEKLRLVAEKIAEEYAISFIGKKITKNYIEDNGAKFWTLYKSRKDSFYAWNTSERDEMLGTIFFYARYRGLVQPLSYYVLDKWPDLIKIVKENLEKDRDNLIESLQKRQDEMPSSKAAVPEKEAMVRHNYRIMIKEYPQSHKAYVKRFTRQDRDK